MAAGDPLFVVADPHEAWILQRVETAERHVGRLFVRTVRIVEQVMRDEKRSRDRHPAFVAQVVHGALDDIHGARARQLRIALNIRDEQLQRREVIRDGPAQALRQV